MKNEGHEESYKEGMRCLRKDRNSHICYDDIKDRNPSSKALPLLKMMIEMCLDKALWNEVFTESLILEQTLSGKSA